ncbi:N/A [soil metagenome]
MQTKIISIKTDSSQTAWIPFFFVVFIFFFEGYQLNVNYSAYLIYLYDTQEIFSAIIAVVFLIISLILFYYFVVVAFFSEARFKIIYFLIFSLASFIEYGYQKALGRFSTTSDIESVVATTSDQKFESIFLYISLASIIPCLVFLICLFVVKNKQPKGLKPFLLTIFLFVVFFICLSTFGSFFIEQKFPTVSFNAFCRTSTDFLIWGPLSNGKWNASITGNNLTRRKVEKPSLPENYRPSNNIVFVIDESVRGDHLSLNGYERKTTPVLDNLQSQGILNNWGIAVSASTGSRFTYNAIITGLTPDDFPDKSEFKVNTFPTIFQYAKAMNYQTHFFDGQMKNYWGGIPDDLNYIDSWSGINQFDDNGLSPKWKIDNRIALEVNKIISNSTGNFIVIFKRGSHIPYQDCFPPDEQPWQPIYTTENKFDIPTAEKLPEVANSYDNAIKYNINSFFENLIKDYTAIPNNTVIIYTGDHGQTLFANGKSSHGGASQAEATVPLFIIGKLEKTVETKYQASHDNIFPTLLDLMNYPENLRGYQTTLSLFDAAADDSKPRFFNPDLGNKVPFY